jgi:hypothetical protein
MIVDDEAPARARLRDLLADIARSCRTKSLPKPRTACSHWPRSPVAG